MATDNTKSPTAGNGHNLTLRHTENSTTAFKTVARENGTLLGPPVATVAGPALPVTIGGASNGTRLIAMFSGIPAGSRLYVSDRNTLNTPAPVIAGNAKLITGADANGMGGALPLGFSGTSPVAVPVPAITGGLPVSYNQLTVTGGAATATWEVTFDDPAQIESLTFTVLVAAKAAAVPVGTAATTVTGSLAPVSTINTPVTLATATVPRFKNSAIAGQGVLFATCVSTLLFPFVTNNGVLNTGVAVSNTSMDTFGTATQAGTCTVNYFGQTTGGGSVPTPQTSSSIAAGQTLLFDLKGGGMGVGATPGFYGYLIAACNFKYAHGIAFITDTNVAQLAFGYTALVMDSSGLRGVAPNDAMGQ